VLAAELVVRVRRLLGVAALGGFAGADHLTPRERDVLALLTEGLSQVEIAARLFITERTVAKHIEHILAKLGVHTRAQAVARALRPAGAAAGR
jgi:DNA-binding CsgD family transcriptional regulator